MHLRISQAVGTSAKWLFRWLDQYLSSFSKTLELAKVMGIPRFHRLALLRDLDRFCGVPERELDFGQRIEIGIGRSQLSDLGSQSVRPIELDTAFGGEPSGIVGDQGVVWESL